MRGFSLHPQRTVLSGPSILLVLTYAPSAYDRILTTGDIGRRRARCNRIVCAGPQANAVEVEVEVEDGLAVASQVAIRLKRCKNIPNQSLRNLAMLLLRPRCISVS
jgi:hypothetical protein